MSAFSVRLPDSLHKAVRSIAQTEHSTMNQVIMLAVAEKVSALMTEDYLKQRAKRGNRKKFLNALEKVS